MASISSVLISLNMNGFTLSLYLFTLCEMYGYVVSTQNNEYCVVDNFNPRCAADEVIIMKEAKYGHIQMGRCIEIDVGYFGCYGNVLDTLDELCSGKQSCDVRVGSNNMEHKSTCQKGLLQYLEAAYECRKALKITDCITQTQVALTEHDTVITSDMAEHRRGCISLNQPFTIAAKSGQVLNISLIDLNHAPVQDHIARPYGKIKDHGDGSEMTFAGGQRFHHLLETSGHQVDITLYTSSNRFALDIKVLGCADLSPPVGSWMTRDGDITELGCHSGKHSWTLRCDGDQWIGAVGYCGSVSGEKPQEKQEVTSVNSISTISTNIIVFGTCSLLLLLSSIIFLIGVLILRKHNKRRYNKYSYQPAAPVMVPINKDLMTFDRASLSLQNSMIGTMPTDCGRISRSQDYKSLQI